LLHTKKENSVSSLFP